MRKLNLFCSGSVKAIGRINRYHYAKSRYFKVYYRGQLSMGRVVHLQPVIWQDGWPVIGVDIDCNGIGKPVYVWKKPDIMRLN